MPHGFEQVTSHFQGARRITARLRQTGNKMPPVFENLLEQLISLFLIA